MTVDVNDLKSKSAFSPIEVTESRMAIDSNTKQSQKMPPLKKVAEFGITTISNPEQSKKANFVFS